ncbi:ABC transporter permease, partial [Flavobacterium sp.]|uniref:ABC transporter permease n=1 Tax=Flavobacterium sp. TaxID=239 RepID=UPI00260CA82B
MSIIALIIKREFIAKVRNKSFIVMTFLSPLLFVAIAAFVGYLSSMKADTKQIAIHDASGLFVKNFTAQNSKKGENKYVDLSGIDTQILKDSIVTESYDGLLVIPAATAMNDFETKIQFVSNSSPSISFIENVQDVIATKITNINLENAHLDTLAIQKAQSKVNISLTKAT